ncbi:Tum protein [Serratia fonticola]|uniref:Tum protein n=1 Tax=Serratia fonticola TaxID=47917 RepID=UPI003BB793F1
MENEVRLNQDVVIERIQMISRLITGQKPKGRDKEIALLLINEIVDRIDLNIEKSYSDYPPPL